MIYKEIRKTVDFGWVSLGIIEALWEYKNIFSNNFLL